MSSASAAAAGWFEYLTPTETPALKQHEEGKNNRSDHRRHEEPSKRRHDPAGADPGARWSVLLSDGQTGRRRGLENAQSERQRRDAAGFRSDNELCRGGVNPPSLMWSALNLERE